MLSLVPIWTVGTKTNRKRIEDVYAVKKKGAVAILIAVKPRITHTLSAKVFPAGQIATNVMV
jgi:hypothetical protein